MGFLQKSVLCLLAVFLSVGTHATSGHIPVYEKTAAASKWNAWGNPEKQLVNGHLQSKLAYVITQTGNWRTARFTLSNGRPDFVIKPETSVTKVTGEPNDHY